MKKKSLSLLALTVFVTLLSTTGCKKEDTKPTDVYAAGTVGTLSGINLATYWKNGTAFNLTDGTYTAYASDILVSGTDVYVCGAENSITKPIAKYWKNGVAVNLSDGTNTSGANGMLISGTDIYVCGYERVGVISTAKYWKNGIAVNLTDGIYSAQATAMVVSGSDVYVAGYQSNNVTTVAKYWKNGVAVELTDGTYNAIAYDLAVIGSDVYVCGYEATASGTGISKYWKNGVATDLSNGVTAAHTRWQNRTELYTLPAMSTMAAAVKPSYGLNSVIQHLEMVLVLPRAMILLFRVQTFMLPETNTPELKT